MSPALTDPHWTQVLSALLVPLVAIFGSIIAYRSWRTTQNKLKLDLFEKRLAIYDGALQLILSVMGSGRATDEAMSRFIMETRGAKWLLNDDIARYFNDELWKQLSQLQCLESELESMPAGDERSKHAREKRDIKVWFQAQHGVLDSKFEPFLKLEH